MNDLMVFILTPGWVFFILALLMPGWRTLMGYGALFGSFLIAVVVHDLVVAQQPGYHDGNGFAAVIGAAVLIVAFAGLLLGVVTRGVMLSVRARRLKTPVLD